MRENRPHIGSREPAPGDPSLSIGLAIRKAISYAIDRQEISNVEHSGEYAITDHPIHMKMGIWCNPNIIRYNHDLDKAREYMTIAGFTADSSDTPGFSIGVAIFSVFVVSTAVYFTTKKRKK